MSKVESYTAPQEESYWSEFYEHHDFSEGSTFFGFVNGLPELPATLVDIGCGEGRDSFAFARAGRQVVGLDRSDIGVKHASDKAATEALDGNLSFAVCDVSNEDEIRSQLTRVREQANGGDVCFYMRFFLHSITEEGQETLMRVVSETAKPGDVFTAEFRTDKDKDHTKTFGDTHYRRYQNAEEFSAALQGQYGWEVVFETEGQGLSPYKDEDPTLYRVLAVRS